MQNPRKKNTESPKSTIFFNFFFRAKKTESQKLENSIFVSFRNYWTLKVFKFCGFCFFGSGDSGDCFFLLQLWKKKIELFGGLWRLCFFSGLGKNRVFLGTLGTLVFFLGDGKKDQPPCSLFYDFVT